MLTPNCLFFPVIWNEWGMCGMAESSSFPFLPKSKTKYEETHDEKQFTWEDERFWDKHIKCDIQIERN
jgi:hypothetical protein